jgi:hypothetical protein
MATMTTRPTTVNPDPIDLPGFPTFAAVSAAMSMEGQRRDHNLWARLNQAWDTIAWGSTCYEGVQERRQQAYEAAAREMARLVPPPAAACCDASEAAPCQACVPVAECDPVKLELEIRAAMNRVLDHFEGQAAESEDMGDASTWPNTEDVDGWFWNPTDPPPAPADADLTFAALTFGADFDDDDFEFAPPDESRACESAAMDAIERSLIPHDLADYISRTSLAGYPA